MALLSPCCRCGKEISHSASEIPLCDDCSGKNLAKANEKKRWDNLTIEQKLDELKNRLDQLDNIDVWSNNRIG